MACSVEQSGNIYNDEDDFFSDTSTIKNYTCGNSDKIQRCDDYINSANFIENEIYRSEDFDTNSNSDDFENNFKGNSSSFAYRKICRIDMSPEAEEKRREAYNNWLKIVNEREKERKRLQREKAEAERLMKLEKEKSKKNENDEKVRQWNEKKRRETQKKMSRINELKQATERKVNEPVKEFKKNLRFEEWVAKKNEEFKKLKAQEEEQKKKFKDYVKTRECVSAVTYKKWMQTSKNTPKPVPLNRGLESLRGSTTKLYVNPSPWKDTNE